MGKTLARFWREDSESREKSALSTLRGWPDGNALIAPLRLELQEARQSQSKPKRPLGVIVIAVIAAAGGILSLFGAASAFSGTTTGPTWLAIVVTIFGILGLALGVGFYTGARWAWMGGIAIYIVSILLGILEIGYGGTIGGVGGIIRIVAGIVIPAYLTRAGPKKFLGKTPASSTA